MASPQPVLKRNCDDYRSTPADRRFEPPGFQVDLRGIFA